MITNADACGFLWSVILMLSILALTSTQFLLDVWIAITDDQDTYQNMFNFLDELLFTVLPCYNLLEGLSLLVLFYFQGILNQR